MSEENKTFELKDKDLEKVSGGFTISEFSIDAGDCFENENYIYKALSNLPRTKDHSICADFYCYNKSLDVYSVINKNAYSVVNTATYIGNNII